MIKRRRIGKWAKRKGSVARQVVPEGGMTVSELKKYLDNPHCPEDAEVRIVDERSEDERRTEFFRPVVVWWSDDRKTVYLGSL